MLKPGIGEYLRDLSAGFGEVLPPFEVSRHDGGSRQRLRDEDGFVCGEGDVSRQNGNMRCAHEEDSDANTREAIDDLFNPFEPYGIAGDVDGVFRIAAVGENEANDWAALSNRRPVLRRSGSHRDGFTAGCG